LVLSSPEPPPHKVNDGPGGAGNIYATATLKFRVASDLD
jgi:hypothetical protein